MNGMTLRDELARLRRQALSKQPRHVEPKDEIEAAEEARAKELIEHAESALREAASKGEAQAVILKFGEADYKRPFEEYRKQWQPPQPRWLKKPQWRVWNWACDNGLEPRIEDAINHQTNEPGYAVIVKF